MVVRRIMPQRPAFARLKPTRPPETRNTKRCMDQKNRTNHLGGTHARLFRSSGIGLTSKTLLVKDYPTTPRRAPAQAR